MFIPIELDMNLVYINVDNIQTLGIYIDDSRPSAERFVIEFQFMNGTSLTYRCYPDFEMAREMVNVLFRSAQEIGPNKRG